MTNDVATALSRLDAALARVERAASASPLQGPAPAGDERYERLRARTQAALAELDTVIARVAEKEQG